MNKNKPTFVLFITLIFSVLTYSQTTFTENAAAFGLDIANPKDGGHAWADYDNDGDQDVLINFNSTSIRNYLMRNNGDGTFTNVQPTLVPGMVAGALAERQAAWGDVNNDGRPDFLMNSAGYPTQAVALQIFIQNADGTFGDGIGGSAPITVGRGGMIVVDPINAEGAGFFDFEGDGDLDIFFDSHDYGIELLRNNYIDHTTHTITNPAPGALYTHITTGNGSGVVEQGLNQYATDGDYGTSADVNDDGWVDIFMRKRNQNDFFLNQGGMFTNGSDLSQAQNSNKGANGLWDLDNDGDLDAVWTENGLTQIFRNDGPGVWVALGASSFPSLPQPSNTDTGTSSAGIDALAGGDIDNDGDIDIILVGDSRSYLYINQLNSPTPAPGVVGSGAAMSFTLDAQTFNVGADGEGTSFIDIDDDGDLDIYMNINNGPNQLYINNLAAANRVNHLLIDVTEDRAADGSVGGYPGRAAIGTNVLIKDCEGNIISGLRQVAGVYGHGNQIPEIVHFGLPLGENETYLIEVRYPNYYDPTDGIRRLLATAIAEPSTIPGTNHYSLTTTDAENIQNDNAPDAADDYFVLPSSDTISIQLNLFENDSDADGDSFYLESVVQPAEGSVTIDDADTGLVTYTYNVAGTPFTGTTFDYTISDAIILCTELGKKDTGTVTLTADPSASASLDFDGIDDYAEQTINSIDGLNYYTVSFWFKYEGDMITNSDEVFVMGQKDAFEVYISDWTGTESTSQKINVRLHSDDGVKHAGFQFEPSKWTHLTVTVINTGFGAGMIVYKNGIASNIQLLGTLDSNSNPFRIAIPNGTTSYKNFKGWIDEVRIFDRGLTSDQAHQMVYQEIENNGGLVRGKVIPKDIVDNFWNITVSWSNLKAYYPMTEIISGVKAYDYSDNNNLLNLYNITTLQPQTAPMPYQTSSDGNLSDSSTWLNGDVWDISDSPNTNFGTIIKMSHNVTTDKSISSEGLIIDTGKTLTVIGDQEVRNRWYLELNGTLDLQGDSQLVQTETSDLVTSADGKILRRQEGNTSLYWYNYWSSPVGTQATVALTDNNGPTNNTNNTPYILSMLRDETGSPVEFTNSYGEPGKISTFWLYTFQNGITYYDWNSIDQNTLIQPGVGYTQKGNGTPGVEQQYTFEGKPNNGTILIAADDVDGDSGNESEPGNTLTTTLIGNPYPSAIDAIQFINDNKPGTGNGTISGTILLWEQWAGTSHYLADYEGGYGYINGLTTERAYQYPEIDIVDQAQAQGIKIPTFQIPVGQGFYVEVINDGNIEFNNGQRVFALESDADGNPNNGSTFFRSSNTETTANPESASSTDQILRLEFGVSSGASRSFVIGFTEGATDGYDYGLDGGLIADPPADDMGSLLNGKQYVIQAFAPYTPDKEIDLVLHASGNFTYTLKSTEISNFPEDQDLFIVDNLTGQFYNLRSTEVYNFTANEGSYTDRFKVIFQEPSTLSNEEFKIDKTLVFVNQLEDKLYVKSLSEKAKELSLTNLLGQNVISYDIEDNQTLKNGVDVSSLKSGVYIVSVRCENNISLDKKIVIN